jgi:hypothetical protein
LASSTGLASSLGTSAYFAFFFSFFFLFFEFPSPTTASFLALLSSFFSSVGVPRMASNSASSFAFCSFLVSCFSAGFTSIQIKLKSEYHFNNQKLCKDKEPSPICGS